MGLKLRVWAAGGGGGRSETVGAGGCVRFWGLGLRGVALCFRGFQVYDSGLVRIGIPKPHTLNLNPQP